MLFCAVRFLSYQFCSLLKNRKVFMVMATQHCAAYCGLTWVLVIIFLFCPSTALQYINNTAVHQQNCCRPVTLLHININRTAVHQQYFTVHQSHCCTSTALLYISLTAVHQPHCCISVTLLYINNSTTLLYIVTLPYIITARLYINNTAVHQSECCTIHQSRCPSYIKNGKKIGNRYQKRYRTETSLKCMRIDSPVDFEQKPEKDGNQFFYRNQNRSSLLLQFFLSLRIHLLISVKKYQKTGIPVSKQPITNFNMSRH